MEEVSEPDAVDANVQRWAEFDADIQMGAPLQITARLMMIYRHVYVWKESLECDGLHISTLETLYPLLLAPPPGTLSATELAQALGLTLSATTVRTEKLIEHGLIERRRCASDGRATRIHLTDSGRSAALTAIQATNAAVEPVSANLSLEETATLNNLLRKVLVGITPSDPRATSAG